MRIAESSDFIEILKIDRHISEEMLTRSISLSQVFVEQRCGEIAGELRFNYFWDSIPFVNLLYIRDAYRGKGIGRGMMLEWEGYMAERGFDCVMTSTLEKETAKHFYEKLGYRRAGSFITPEGDEELLYMKKI